jgi:hypothetical protein
LTFDLAANFISGVYLLFMTALFASTFSRKKPEPDENLQHENPLVTVIVFISQREDLSVQNFIALFNQDYPKEKTEYLLIDQTGSYDNLRDSDEIFYETHHLPLSIKTLSWKTITEIIQHKSRGEIVLFIQGRSHVSSSWIKGIVNSFCKPGIAMVLPKLVSEAQSDQHWFQAEQSLFRSVLSLAFARWRIFYSVKLNNIAFWRKDLLDSGSSYLAWLARRMKQKPSAICSDGMETIASVSPPESWRAFMREYTSQLTFTNALLTHSAIGLLFIMIRVLMILSPAAFFILYLLNISGIIPVLLLFFAKFIGEGLIISRGARLYQRQDLLYPFWSWFFLAPIVYGLGFFRSLFQQKRIKSF